MKLKSRPSSNELHLQQRWCSSVETKQIWLPDNTHRCFSINNLILSTSAVADTRKYLLKFGRHVRNGPSGANKKIYSDANEELGLLQEEIVIKNVFKTMCL